MSVSQDIVSNQVDFKGLKQGYWINYKIDTSIVKWQAILTDNSGIDTNICQLIYATGYYKNNKKDSIWKVYDTYKEKYSDKKTSHGNLIYEANFKNDSLNGILKTYYVNGNVKSEIEFKNNIAVGIINCYTENGKLKYTGLTKLGIDFFDGTEYNNGIKLRDRKFNYNVLLKEWTNINDLFTKLEK